MRTRNYWLHPATLLAVVALVFSMGGVGYAAAKINTKDLANGAVTTKKLASGSVSVSKIRSGAVSASKIRAGAVGSSALADGSVAGVDLAAGAVGTAALADGSVTTAKLADGNVTEAKLGDGSVTNAKIGDQAVTRGRISNRAVGEGKLDDAAVTTAKIADGAVTAAKITPGSVVLGNGSVQGTGTTLTNTQTATVVEVPGLARVTAVCTSGKAELTLTNTSGVEARLSISGQSPVLGTPKGQIAASTLVADGSYPLANPGDNGVQQVTWQFWSPIPGGTRMATITSSAFGNLTDCFVAAQAVVTG